MQRKKVLVLSFFPAFLPPKSGGELRLCNICKNLSKYYDITILSFTYPGEKYQKYTLFPDVTEIRIPKSKIHEVLHHAFYKYGHIAESSGIIVSIASHFSNNYKNIFNQLIKDSDIIISTHPYLYKKVNDKFVIYESYNMEYNLQKKALGSSIIAKILSRYVYYIEKNACLSSDMVFAVSEEDKNDFHKVYKAPLNRIFLAPNGVDINEIKESTVFEKEVQRKKLNLKGNKILLFIGSAHPPNIEAARVIIDELAPSLPEFTFLIVGKVSEYFINYRNEMKELNKNNIENFFSNTDKTAAITHGWYSVEYWNGIATRWTRKAFGFAAKDTGISRIFFKAFSLKETRVNVKVNDVQMGRIVLKPLTWEQYEFEFVPVGNILLNVEVEKTTRETGGSRTLGIAIQEIGYESRGIKKKIAMEENCETVILRHIPRNVKIMCEVNDETKKALLKASDAALNPQMYGSGSNLKMLEYLAAGLPVITTPTGARGIDIINNTHAIVCEVKEFKKNILILFKDEAIKQKLEMNGRSLVEEKYEWTKISDNMHDDIEMCHEKKNASGQ